MGTFITPNKVPKRTSKAKQRTEDYLKYQRYIRSKEFKEIKQLVEERDEHKCRVCGRTKEDGIPLSCHHTTYNNLYNEREHLDDLITLCKICHNAIHNALSNKRRFKRS